MIDLFKIKFCSSLVHRDQQIKGFAKVALSLQVSRIKIEMLVRGKHRILLFNSSTLSDFGIFLKFDHYLVKIHVDFKTFVLFHYFEV